MGFLGKYSAGVGSARLRRIARGGLDFATALKGKLPGRAARRRTDFAACRLPTSITGCRLRKRRNRLLRGPKGASLAARASLATSMGIRREADKTAWRPKQHAYGHLRRSSFKFKHTVTRNPVFYAGKASFCFC